MLIQKPSFKTWSNSGHEYLRFVVVVVFVVECVVVVVFVIIAVVFVIVIISSLVEIGRLAGG